MTDKKQDYIKRIIDLCELLTKDYDEQCNSFEDFVRWNLPDEIGLSWIDDEYILKSEIVKDVLGIKRTNIVITIFNNFENAFANHCDVWTDHAMKTHFFWKTQRDLAKQLLSSLDASLYSQGKAAENSPH